MRFDLTFMTDTNGHRATIWSWTLDLEPRIALALAFGFGIGLAIAGAVMWARRERE